MNLPDDKKQDALRLRAAAERQIDNAPKDEPLARTAEELLHELQVHQVELEMQNEALRQAQIMLTESRDRYVDLYEFAPIGYLTLGAEGMIEQINLTGATLLGRERNKLLQRRFTSLVIAEDRDRFVRHFLGVKQGDGADRGKFELQRGDGTAFQAQLDCVHEEGSALGVRITLIDTSERNAAKQAKLELVDFAMAIGNNVPGMLGYWDRELRCGFANRHYLEWFGRTGEQMQGIRIQEMLGEELFRQNEPHMRAALRGEAQQFERTLVKPDGETGYTWAQYVPYWIGGEVQGFFALVTDISRLKQEEALRAALEQQLRESQKMEAIGTLAGGIAHDFNNALATILGNLELARQDSANNPAVLESLEEIRKAGSRARDLVQQILAFSRRQPSERKPLDVGPVVLEAVHLLRATLPPRISIDVHCGHDVPPVLGNATQIEQVLINLATNAMQAMHSGPGLITLRLDTVDVNPAMAEAHPALRTLHERHPGLTVRISVSDTGQGMDAATRERIFEPFFTTKPVNEGTGLGLSVVHGIVQGHEGVITVESEAGKGTTFTLYLPVAPAMSASQPDAPLPDTTPALSLDGGQRILYLDDDASLLSLVPRLLERRGYRVDAYSEPQVALAALRADPAAFDLVLTDYNMPGMSGLEVAREARRIRADLPVAVASGFIDETLREQAAEAGVRELLFKADEVEAFCAAVQRLVQNTNTPIR